jgi:membrane-bound inhibitor of C-type lysozyme
MPLTQFRTRLSAGLMPLIAAAATLSAHQAATPAPPATDEKSAAVHRISASFSCQGGRKIQAQFVTGARPSVTLTLSDGRHLILPQALSGSGARYANPDESVVFWNKGRTAFINEGSKQTYSGCLQD